MAVVEYTLAVFQGPLDLLLHLIEKHKIDIYDIPIAHITAQYMEQLEAWNHFDVQYSSEFLVMAATLLQIKSRLLLPKRPKDEDEGEDPRDELVQKLIEFKTVKALSALLEERTEGFGKALARPEECSELGLERVYQFPLDKLYGLFCRQLEEDREDGKPQPKVQVQKDSLTLGQCMGRVRQRLSSGLANSLGQLMDLCESKEERVLSFLAILELLKIQFIEIVAIDGQDAHFQRRAEEVGDGQQAN